MGDVLDAAERLGWSDAMGDLSLEELAQAMLGQPDAEPEAEDDHQVDATVVPNEAASEEQQSELAYRDDESAEYYDEDEYIEGEYYDEQDEEEDDFHVVLVAPSARNAAPAAEEEPVEDEAYDADSDAEEQPEEEYVDDDAYYDDEETENDDEDEPAAKPSTTSSNRKRNARVRALKRKIAADEPMSLEEAVDLFVPLVAELGETTMQDLENLTGVGRRKLRFHVGQLVREGHLERHGMGRGTYYTAVEYEEDE